jgi:tetratricopeptide (TPR) repeat protein
MVYLLIRMNFFSQLDALAPDLTEKVVREIDRAGLEAGFPPVSARAGSVLFGLGQRSILDPERSLDFVFRVSSLLEKHREDLMGYQILLSEQEDGLSADIEKALRGLLLRSESEEEILLDAPCRDLFGESVELTARGDFWTVPRRVLKPGKHKPPFHSAWMRSSMVERVLDALAVNLDQEAKDGILLIVDPQETDRKMLMEHVLGRLFGTFGPQPVPRMVTLFQRRSPLHPFLNSIDPSLLGSVADHLKPGERETWSDVGDLLHFLKFGREGICPDHLSTDFYLAYHLYLLAYLRRMEGKLLPGVFIAEDVDSYHPAALSSLLLLLHDFSHHPAFLPVLIASSPVLPAELQPLRVRRLFLRKMNRNDIQELSGILYPGLEIPRGAAYQVRKASDGQWTPMCHYLEYLRQAGKIADREGRYSWVSRKEMDVPFPTNPLQATWSLVESLPALLRRVLHAVYLSAGLLDRGGLAGFLESLGVNAEASARGLKTLREYGLICGGEYLVPMFPPIRTRLESLAEKNGESLEEELCAFLVEQWHGGRYGHPVLLYYYLIRKKKVDLVLGLLPQFLNRKLDERDLEGANLFLQADRLGFEDTLEPEDREELRLTLTSARLRAALLAGRRAPAEEAAGTLQAWKWSPALASRKSRVFLELVRYHQEEGSYSQALDWAKKALMEAQAHGDALAESRSYLEIGSTMLSEGKLEEALEYLSFSDSFDRSAPLDEIRAVGLRAIALFVSGNLTLALSVTARGIGVALAAKRREWEVLLRFLKGRILFELGRYREALKEFQDDLTIAALYSLGSAIDILYCWMARAMNYCAEGDSALRLLRFLEDRPEKLYFQAEALHRLGDTRASMEALDQALQLLPADGQVHTGEGIDWRDGFSAIEGRCAVLWAGRSLPGRLLASFRAFLQGAEGTADLYAITRAEKIPDIDPFLSHYHYFYARIIPEARQHEMDEPITVLNRAFKILQQRGARIESSAERYQYLHNNYWNSQILKDASRRRLI